MLKYKERKHAKKIKESAGSSPVVILQNGLDVERPFIEAGFPAIYRCVLFTTSQVLSEDLVKAQQAAYSVAGVDEEVCEPTMRTSMQTAYRQA